MTGPTLLIMRHAEAEPPGGGVEDRDRRLTPAGRARAAAQAAVVTPALAAAPAVVLCSAARRTRETLGQLAVQGAEVRIEEDLYGAGPDEVVQLLAALPAEVGAALVVGHMPTVAQLLGALADADPWDVSFRPGDVAVLQLAGPWAELGAAPATVVRSPA